MVLCSIEEAWGTDFNNKKNKKNNNNPKYNKTYDKNMPPHPQFSRDTTPLKNHNGKNRIPLVQTIENEQINKEQQNYYNKEASQPSYYSEEEDSDDDIHNENNTNNINEPNEEYYDYLGSVTNDDNYSEYNEETYDDDDDDDDEYQQQQQNETNYNDTIHDSYRGGQNGEAHVTVNISHLMDKVNKLVNYLEKQYKRNGNENQDVFLFIVIGIFIIFIMDLIFRIAVKVSQKTIST